MRNFGFLSLIALFFLPSASFAADPVGACRVKAETLGAHASLVGNAGCVITKQEDGVTKFLLVYADKGPDDKGWGFPGGSPATTEKDSEVEDSGEIKSETTHAIAQNIPFDYQEPTVCTASREMREELGFEVVVGDFVNEELESFTKYGFAAFHCLPVDPAVLEGEITPQDTQEILDIGWFTVEEMAAPDFLRYDNNLLIAREFLKNS